MPLLNNRLLQRNLNKHRHEIASQKRQELKTNFRKQYYSTFASGLENFVLSFLSKLLPDFKCLKLLDGGIIYTTCDPVKNISFFKNTFLVIKTVANTDNLSLEKIITQLFFIARINYKLEKKSFRIFAFDKNQPYSIKPGLLSKMENEVVKKLHLKIDRADPYYHFWFLKRSENISLFLLKINSKKSQKPSKGELHRDIIETLIEIAGVDKNDIVLDPFAGTGAIGNYIAERDFQMIINIEKDKELVLKQKSIKKNFNNKIIFKQGDFLTIDIPKSGKINKIVTDPPWGFFEKIEDIDLFYIKMLRKMLEISIKNVVIVILCGDRDLMLRTINFFKNEIILTEEYNILLSGKKAGIYKLEKAV